jgi:hypothetical protein
VFRGKTTSNRLLGYTLGGPVGLAAITTLSYITHTTTTTPTISFPASGVETGDLIVISSWGENTSGGSGPADVTPSEFTSIGTLVNGGGRVRASAFYKIAEGDEDGTTVTGINGNIESHVLIQYRANLPIVSLTASTPVSTGVIGNPAQQTIAASAGTPPVLGIAMFCNMAASSSINPRTTSITPDHSINPSTHHYVHDYIQNSSPADYTFDMDDEGDGNNLFGFYIHSLTP